MASRYRPARGTAAKSRPPARRYTAQTDRDMTRGSPHRRQTSHLPAARPVPCPAAREAHLCRPRPPRPKRPSAFQIPSRSATRPLFCATYTEPAALRPPARNPAPAQFPRTPSAKRAAEPQPIFAISPFFTPRRGRCPHRPSQLPQAKPETHRRIRRSQRGDVGIAPYSRRITLAYFCPNYTTPSMIFSSISHKHISQTQKSAGLSPVLLCK